MRASEVERAPESSLYQAAPSLFLKAAHSAAVPLPAGEVFVEEVVPAGNADKQGVVQAGDVVLQCSATVLKAGGGFRRQACSTAVVRSCAYGCGGGCLMCNAALWAGCEASSVPRSTCWQLMLTDGLLCTQPPTHPSIHPPTRSPARPPAQARRGSMSRRGMGSGHTTTGSASCSTPGAR